MNTTTILPLDSPSATLAVVGGKGANLARLARAGFAVPPGFLVTTAAYRAYVEANRLDKLINHVLSGLAADDPAALTDASDEIRRAFSEGKMPPELEDALIKAYAPLDNRPVAVRSSATAEDLPDFSFAGQQDTYLNIIGAESLLKAVVDCWSSLWTARAIGYRARNRVAHHQVALAVVVQELVPAAASGVLFTANPLTGHRQQAVIDATLGLGEALVGGHVEPDHFVVEKSSGRILSSTLGKKAVALQPDPAGGLVRIEDNAAARRASIDPTHVARINALGRDVEAVYNNPQDIEWAVADDQVYLLQSRPITSLFPLPDYPDKSVVPVYFSFGSVQGLLGPMTPLGQDAIRLLFAGMSSIFGVQSTPDTQQSVFKAGERLWMNFTGLLRHPIGSRMVSRLLYAVDPGAYETIQQLRDDPALQVGAGRLRLQTFVKVARLIRVMSRPARRAWRNPETQAAEIEVASHAEIARIDTVAPVIDAGGGRPTGFATALQYLFAGFPYAVPNIAAGALPGLVSFFVLNKLAARWGANPDLAMTISRGLPNNVTTEMDLKLWETARIIGEEAAARQLFMNTDAVDLAESFSHELLPRVAQDALSAFLIQYGMRGLGEIDFGRPRWRENPTQIIQTIQSYLKIDDPHMAPNAVFKRGEAAAEAAIDELAKIAQGRLFGGRKARLVRALARRARGLSGLRESPKFHLIRLMGIIRKRLLAAGDAFVSAGVFSDRQDIFFLTLAELEALDRGEARLWAELTAERRAIFEREQDRKQIPRILLGDGRAFYEGVSAIDDGSGDLAGSPVSPGLVEGSVRVVHDPGAANLQPGEILVCEGTDPAWTPLFLAAGGLVMEVGGLMTHGAIVAREYGIPAVVGVDRATTRLQTGQKIRVDGSSGRISYLD